jgi:hypothetical protein
MKIDRRSIHASRLQHNVAIKASVVGLRQVGASLWRPILDLANAAPESYPPIGAISNIPGDIFRQLQMRTR